MKTQGTAPAQSGAPATQQSPSTSDYGSNAANQEGLLGDTVDRPGLTGQETGSLLGGLLGGPAGSLVGGFIGGLFDDSENPAMLDAHAGDAEYEDFSDNPLFVDGISPEDVIQANLNDCYFVAVLASIAGSDPSFIEGMVQSSGPGSYKVRFFEKQEDNSFKVKWIAVSAELPSQDGSTPLYAHSEDTNSSGQVELWPSVIEKAYAKFKGDYADIDWGNSRYAYEAIFGEAGTMSDTGATEEDDQWVELTEALDSDQAVVCSTGRHVISVLQYRSGDDTREVEVRDQAQAGEGSDGREWISFTTFRSRYTYFRYADTAEVGD